MTDRVPTDRRTAEGDPVLSVVLERVRSASSPGTRSDGHVVALAIEGGGMRGVVSAGMCAVLEEAGLVSAFDRIYGSSAGAITGRRLVRRLSTDRGRIAESLRLGATAMASALYGEPARLMWRPVPYLARGAATEEAVRLAA